MDYRQRRDIVMAWVEIINYHWHRLKGQVHNDPEFWQHTLYSMNAEDWWSCLAVTEVIAIKHPELVRKYPRLREDRKTIESRLNKARPVIQAKAKSYNLEPFRFLMTMKDLVNEIRGQPTPQWTDRQRALTALLEQTTQFERLYTEE